ncbi:hypothetical protein HPP92_017813 [Vanilla planifolia]|uniref:Uncharacterized protein n=1 Tax=Vanilla planifolia TaxID=51239 RepID=A0A835Q8M9_VANPL|nr:hypothetical protein HPP92_017813 [Vanilla planifolia]
MNATNVSEDSMVTHEEGNNEHEVTTKAQVGYRLSHVRRCRFKHIGFMCKSRKRQHRS